MLGINSDAIERLKVTAMVGKAHFKSLPFGELFLLRLFSNKSPCVIMVVNCVPPWR